MSDDHFFARNSLVHQIGELNKTIESLRAENEKLREVSRWNIERDGDDIYLCESNHDKGDKCEYERWYPRAHVEVYRQDVMALKKRERELFGNIQRLVNALRPILCQEIVIEKIHGADLGQFQFSLRAARSVMEKLCPPSEP